MQTLTLEGYLAADPSILSAQGSGKKRASFRVLETTRFRKADGTPGERTTGFNCICFNEATTEKYIEAYARKGIRAIRNRRAGDADPGGPVVAFRGAPTADTADDAGRIFDALNWALKEWPDMALATTGAKGSEKLAIKWSRQKGVKLILARADFDTHGKAAPFRANDELIALEPTCCLTLVHSLDRARSEDSRPFGPALNLGQKAMESGLRHVCIKARAA